MVFTMEFGGCDVAAAMVAADMVDVVDAADGVTFCMLPLLLLLLLVLLLLLLGPAMVTPPPPDDI